VHCPGINLRASTASQRTVATVCCWPVVTLRHHLTAWSHIVPLC
jgi:hypothetical protein